MSIQACLLLIAGRRIGGSFLTVFTTVIDGEGLATLQIASSIIVEPLGFVGGAVVQVERAFRSDAAEGNASHIDFRFFVQFRGCVVDRDIRIDINLHIQLCQRMQEGELHTLGSGRNRNCLSLCIVRPLYFKPRHTSRQGL